MGRLDAGGVEGFLSDLGVVPVIPAVRGPDDALERALAGQYPAIFVLGGDLFRVIRRLEEEEARPRVFVNVDLVGGVAADASGISFLGRHVEGVISTHRHTIELAKEVELITVQRLFAIDSGAVERGLKLIRRAAPDLVEILPAMAFTTIRDDYHKRVEQPVLAGGLLKNRAEVTSLLKAGAVGVSVSNRSLWRT